MAEELVLTVAVRGSGRIVELTPLAESITFSTQAIGGFSACSFSVPLNRFRDLPKLAHVTLLHGTSVLWEGRIEDQEIDVLHGKLTLACFGFQRLLDDVSIKRIWLLRSIPWQLVNQLSGSLGATTLDFDPITWAWSTIGRYDDSDLTRTGLRFSAQTGVAAGAGAAHGAWYWTDAPMTHVFFKATKVGTDPAAIGVRNSPDGSSWLTILEGNIPSTTGTELEAAIHDGAEFLQFIALFPSAVSGANVAIEVENIRILGVSETEDVKGGFYPHTLLRDLVAQVPGLKQGVIDNDTSFAIEQLSRVQRDKALSVVQEISAYFSKRWGVWEDRRFDWRTTNLDEAQWVIPLDRLSGLSVTSSIDNVAKTIYLAYTHVATGLPEEESALASDRRNPYVVAGDMKDEVLSAPVGMTARSAARLAERLSQDHGSLPAVRGTCKLPARMLVDNLTGTTKPACHIRAGENVLIPELPKDEYLSNGRDGQTLFHVTATQTDMAKGETHLALDGYTRSSDVLMARIAAATRTLTG